MAKAYKIVFMGSPAFALPALEALVKSPHKVVGVFSQPPRQKNRGMQAHPTPVHTYAQAHNIPVFTPEKLDAEAQTILKKLAPDFIVVAAYGLLLPQAVLDVAPPLNIHPSALPRWRGAAPLNWTILSGDSTTEVCIMEMVKALDAGPVYARKPLPLSPNETAGSLHDKAAELGAELLLEVLDHWPSYEDNALPQLESGVTYAHKIEKEDRKTNFAKPAATVVAQINGLSPFPSATATFEGIPFKLLLAEPTEGKGTPGQVLHADSKKGLVVACQNGAIRLRKLQRAGKPPMEDTALLRGFGIEVGKQFT